MPTDLPDKYRGDTQPQPVTNLGRFLAQRGLLLMKEWHNFGTLDCKVALLTIKSVIIAIARTQGGERQYGLSMEAYLGGTQHTDNAFIDFDELDGLVGALVYFRAVAQKLAGQQRDYTEFIFTTKDGIRLGFYQTEEREQKAFVDLSGVGRNVFFSTKKLDELRDKIEEAKRYLVSRGAQTGQ